MPVLASVLPFPPHARPVRHRRPAEALHLRRMRREASDEELMLRYGKGDAGAFEALYRRHRLPLYRFLLRQVGNARSEEHTSELQSQSNLVCRLLLEKKKKKRTRRQHLTT